MASRTSGKGTLGGLVVSAVMVGTLSLALAPERVSEADTGARTTAAPEAAPGPVARVGGPADSSATGSAAACPARSPRSLPSIAELVAAEAARSGTTARAGLHSMNARGYNYGSAAPEADLGLLLFETRLQ